MHQPFRNYASRILTLSFAELQQAEVGQNARLSEPPSYVKQTRLCYLYLFLLSNSATTMHLHARPQPPNCKGCALSLINRQSDSHRKTTNTCIANAVDWIQNPIDTFRIHMEIRVFEYLF